MEGGKETNAARNGYGKEKHTTEIDSKRYSFFPSFLGVASHLDVDVSSVYDVLGSAFEERETSATEQAPRGSSIVIFSEGICE